MDVHELLRAGAEPLEIMRAIDGYYECSKNADGKRLGPLVGYAGTYFTFDGVERQKVGDVYINFAAAEEDGHILGSFALQILGMLHRDPAYVPLGFSNSTGFCGAPEGGKALATAFAVNSGKRYIFPEKEVTALPSATSREVSELVWGRHEPKRGEKWWIVEDVCNNFSTTGKLVSLIESRGASVLGIICFANRSMSVDREYALASGKKIPVLSLVRKPFEDYRQDDPFVSMDVQSGNVVWSPKKEWARLKACMEKK